jgi:hypothetical protein
MGKKGRKDQDSATPAPKSKTPKSKAAVQLGQLGGLARAKKLSSEERKEIARKAAKARWGK